MPELSVRYDSGWVAASMAISAAAAYLALTLVERMRAAGAGWPRRLWLVAGSLAMGGGIWSMHYLGMLAAQLPVAVYYDWRIVAVSALMAMVTSALVLEHISRDTNSPLHVLLNALWMAAGIGGMHYTGMAAMRSQAMEQYNDWLVALSVAAAVVFAWLSLTVALRARMFQQSHPLRQRVLSAVLMGIGIAAMHYTAMASVTFHDMGMQPSLAHTVQVGLLGKAGVALVTLVVLAVTLTGAWLDERRIERLSEFNLKLRHAHEQLRDSHRQLRETHEELSETHLRLNETHRRLNETHLALQAAHEDLRLANEELEYTQVELLKTQAQLCEMSADLGELSARDGLTGVFNRRHFDRTLETEFHRAARSKGPLALLMIDIDHFKHLNDTHGHQYGDLCLKRVAEVLMDVPKRDYDLVARYGGEEFVVLMPESRTDGAMRKAEMIRQRILQLRMPETDESGEPTAISVSIGVCICWPRPTEQAQELVHEADKALYRAKTLGRNRVELASVLQAEMAS